MAKTDQKNIDKNKYLYLYRQQEKTMSTNLRKAPVHASNSKSFTDKIKILMFKPKCFLYEHMIIVFFILGFLLVGFIAAAVITRNKLVHIALASLVCVLIIIEILNVSLSYKNDSTPSGAWTKDQYHTHTMDHGLAQELLTFFKDIHPTRVVDLGCGNCGYANALIESGVNVLALDGNDTMGTCHGPFTQMDFGKETFEVYPGEILWVYSFEVGEHIPKDKEAHFFDLLTKGDGVIVSWAIPGQGGDGHINERKTSYVCQKIKDRGFAYDKSVSQRMRDASCLPYFVHNLMVFRRIRS